MTNECGQEAEQVMEISRLSGGESLVCEKKNLIFDACVRRVLASGEI